MYRLILEVVLDFSFSESFTLTNLVIQLSSSHVLKDKYDAVIFFIDLVDVDDARMVQFDEHVDFVSGFEEEGLVYFSSKDLSCVSAYDFSDCGLGPV